MSGSAVLFLLAILLVMGVFQMWIEAKGKKHVLIVYTKVVAGFSGFFGSTRNEVRSTESRKLLGEDELSTDRDVKNFGIVDGKQI